MPMVSPANSRLARATSFVAAVPGRIPTTAGTSSRATIRSSSRIAWTFHNGDPASFGASSAGNAEGFKLGGDSSFGAPHIARRLVAFNNRYGRSSAGRAFHQNDNTRGITLLNCLSFSNNYNYSLNNDISESHLMENCVGFDGITKNVATNSNTIQISNTWNIGGIAANAADFLDLTEASAKAPRNADGSLPSNNFGRLVTGSDLIDRGANIGLPFNGSAPDLGAFEFSAAPRSIQFDSSNLRFTNGELQSSPDRLNRSWPVSCLCFQQSVGLVAYPYQSARVGFGGGAAVDSNAISRSFRFYRAEETMNL